MTPVDALDHVLAVAELALRNWQPQPTGFLDPEEWLTVEPVLRQRSGLHWRRSGGIVPAERQRLLLAREELPLSEVAMDFALVALKGNFLFDPVELEDFEAALLTTDIDPRGWGDVILLGESGAQLIATPACAAALHGRPVQVRTVTVEATTVPWSHLRHQPRHQPRTITTVEASCRLDAVASAGLGLSRARMAAAISAGRVRLNGRTVLRPHTELQVGDVVVLRGRGELHLQSRVLTRRQRWRLQLLRY